ncbi:hypothetical protein HJC23_013076 [Cyclotella cryptica]|uniref:VOC domain-containing protein n=1 Tax=Cyclotella cryptica TaxID=29204 RepID=A0ABD3Q813_9STRA
MPAVPLSSTNRHDTLPLEPAATSFSVGPSHLRNLLQHASRQQQRTDFGLDLRGIVWLEHLNLVVGSMDTAKTFYVDFLGLTVDAGNAKHFNLGQQQVRLPSLCQPCVLIDWLDQFHLAATDDPPQRVTGSICLTVPSLENIRRRAQAAQNDLKGTLFSIREYDNLPKDSHDNLTDKMMTVTCPWGNTFHLFDISIDDDHTNAQPSSPQKMVNLHLEGGSYGSHRMAVRGGPGIRAVEISCKQGSVDAIARFYETSLGCTVVKEKPGDSSTETKAIAVSVGPGVHLVFVENEFVSNQDFDMMNGVHACIYVAEFKNMYTTLQSHGLIWTNPRFTHLDSCDTWEEAFASRTFRFKDILDIDTGEKMLELEHETRPMMHGQYLKVPRYIPN